ASPAHGADRWRRVALASAKQSRRARIPEISDPVPFDVWRRTTREGLTLFLVEPSLECVEPQTMRSLTSTATPRSLTVVVGPEGGWSPAEVTSAVSDGLLPVTLGPLTLRAEAVPLAALAALTVIWD